MQSDWTKLSGIFENLGYSLVELRVAIRLPIGASTYRSVCRGRGDHHRILQKYAFYPTIVFALGKR